MTGAASWPPPRFPPRRGYGDERQGNPRLGWEATGAQVSRMPAHPPVPSFPSRQARAAVTVADSGAVHACETLVASFRTVAAGVRRRSPVRVSLERAAPTMLFL